MSDALTTSLADRLRRLQSGGASAVDAAASAVGDLGLEDRLRRLQGALTKTDPSTASGAFGRATAATFLDNFLGLPDVVANSVREGARVPPVLTRALNPFASLSDPAAAQAADSAFYDRDLRLGQRNLPVPRGDQVVAAFNAFAPGDGSLPNRYRAEMARGEQMRSDHPIASALGDVGGDVATIFTGRIPFANAVRTAESAIAGLKSTAQVGTNLRDIQNFFTSGAMKSLYRGMGRTAETGLEGALLSTLKGGDAREMAGWSMGTQAAGSALLNLSGVSDLAKGGWQKGITKLIGSSILAGSLFQYGKELMPGGKNKILESIEGGYEHVIHGLLSGVISGALGLGRIRANDHGAFIKGLGEAFNTTQRGTTLSFLNSMLKEADEGGTDLRNTAAHLLGNPDGFNKSQITQLSNALENGTLGPTVKKMVDTDPRFRAMIDTDPRQAAAEEEATRAAKERRRELRKRLDERRAD